MQVDRLSWSELIPYIGLEAINDELDNRTTQIFDDLRQVASVCSEDATLIARLRSWKNDQLFLARDQYLRTVLHLATNNGTHKTIKVFGTRRSTYKCS